MLVLVDTSIWIDLLGKKPKHSLTESDLEKVTICPPILQEILQGISNDTARGAIRERLLALPSIADAVSVDDYLAASELYVLGRKKGHTIRSSVDCLIATLALKRNVPIWHNDRDYEAIAAFTGLRTLRGRSM